MNTSGRNTLIFFLLFLLFISNFLIAQEKKDSLSMFAKVKEYFTSVETDSLSLVMLNTFDKTDRIKFSYILNGFYINGIYSQRTFSSTAINEISYLPLYSESPLQTIIGGEFSFIINPIMISLNYSGGTVSLDTLNIKIAKPPFKPDQTSFGESLNFKVLGATISYIPFSLLWGRVFPIIGINVSANNYQIQNENKTFTSIGVSGELLIKQRNFFFSLQHIKYLLNSENILDITNIKAGIFFRLF